MEFEIIDGYLVDRENRIVVLNGINLSGISKYPDKETQSFVNRPFDLASTPDHLKRLHGLGFNLIRFITTWEAIEKEGPNCYDEAYLDYVLQFIQLAKEHHFYVIIDFHQDVFSRHLYGSGAPKWAIESAGINCNNLLSSDAVIDPQSVAKEEGLGKHLVWFLNYHRIASQAMFTFFFGGNDFTPSLKVEGAPIQEYFQEHYIKAALKLIDRVKGEPNVIGYNTMNEPNRGLIESSLRPKFLAFDLGATPTPLQSILLGNGYAQKVPIINVRWLKKKVIGKKLLNQQQIKIWKAGCPFEKEGVYIKDADGDIHLLKPDYFVQKGEKKLSFLEDYYKPFIHRMKGAIDQVAPHLFCFVEHEVGEYPPNMKGYSMTNLIGSAHWYDGLAMLFHRYFSWISFLMYEKKLVFGFPKKVCRLMKNEFQALIQDGKKKLSKDSPTFITETGIPRKLKGSLFEHADTKRKKAFHRLFTIFHELHLSYCIWQYAPEGDGWNFENLTIYCEGEKNDVTPFLRPFLFRLPGQMGKIDYCLKTKRFHLEFNSNRSRAPLELIVPLPPKKIESSAGSHKYDEMKKRFYFSPSRSETHHFVTLSFY